MTPIKTLEEAKKEFKREYRYLFESEETGKFYPDALEKTWNWFESTLSSLTEQMIPEEKRWNILEGPDRSVGEIRLRYTLKEKTANNHGYNQAIKEMIGKRAQILK